MCSAAFYTRIANMGERGSFWTQNTTKCNKIGQYRAIMGNYGHFWTQISGKLQIWENRGHFGRKFNNYRINKANIALFCIILHHFHHISLINMGLGGVNAKCFHKIAKCFTKTVKCFHILVKCLQNYPKIGLKRGKIGQKGVFFVHF